MRKKVHSG